MPFLAALAVLGVGMVVACVDVVRAEAEVGEAAAAGRWWWWWWWWVVRCRRRGCVVCNTQPPRMVCIVKTYLVLVWPCGAVVSSLVTIVV